MGSLQLKNLRNIDKFEIGYTFVDLALDIEDGVVRTKFTNASLPGKDIKVDYDIAAINNSLRNIFSTVPGERFLVPKFGANLKRYLFSPITDETGRRIGQEIVRAIERWEPRVVVDFVDVLGKPEDHEYDVTIKLTVVGLNKPVTFNMLLNRESSIDLRDLKQNCPT